MCGIVGFIECAHAPIENTQAILIRMMQTVRHRGPDGNGQWIDPRAGIALGHTRLAIIDLTAQGTQPMHSRCGRYVLVFNGEIYNFRQLRQELETRGHAFRGHSDTEVLLACVTEHGLESTLPRLNGMFAFALWDTRERKLHLVRDRLGEKPLYYGTFGNTFMFASELKALRAHPAFHNYIDRNALALYMRHNCIPAPYSIYNGVYKLLPAHRLTVDMTAGTEPLSEAYWSLREAAAAGIHAPFQGTAEEALNGLDNMLSDAVRIRMESDVPLGAFLSGGIDSSLIVAQMQRISATPVKSFTIGFREDAYNEACQAKSVAQHLGTDHTELYVTPEQAREVIPRLADMYDEPFADSSQIPTFLISQLTRAYVTVSLSGDGGDEVFAGYNRYTWINALWKKIGWMPLRTRQTIARMLMAITPSQWDAFFAGMGRITAGRGAVRNAGDKIHKMAQTFSADSPFEIYAALVSHWQYPEIIVNGAIEPHTAVSRRETVAGINFVRQMMFLDSLTYLPDDILVKVDRASMAVSLESRVPYLDHRLIEFAWKLPISMHLRNNERKWLLKHLLYRYVPRHLVDRPKMGFGIPIDQWLRGPLKEWAQDLLDEGAMRRAGILNARAIREKWAQHLSGRRNWQYHLWDILMFQAWYQRWG